MNRLLLSLASVLVVSSLAHGAITVTTDFQTNNTTSLPNPYTVSSDDLLNGLAPSAEAGTFTQEGTGGTAVLTDGLFPSPITRDGDGPFQFGAFATGGNNGGTTVTYTLTAPSDIDSIVVYGGWQDGGRDQQAFNILYSTAGDPANFLPLSNVNFNPPAPAGAFPQLVRTTFATDDATTLAQNVAALRFDFQAVENGYTGYAEIDVIPTVIPEPASLALAGLGAVGMLLVVLRRRRRSLNVC